MGERVSNSKIDLLAVPECTRPANDMIKMARKATPLHESIFRKTSGNKQVTAKISVGKPSTSGIFRSGIFTFHQSSASLKDYIQCYRTCDTLKARLSRANP